MCEALFNILFNYSARGRKRRERGGIDLFNLCRTTLGDNYFPDIRNNIHTTAPLLFRSLPLMLVPMSGEEIYPKNRQKVKKSWSFFGVTT
jgi:hypothetical protein